MKLLNSYNIYNTSFFRSLNYSTKQTSTPSLNCRLRPSQKPARGNRVNRGKPVSLVRQRITDTRRGRKKLHAISDGKYRLSPSNTYTNTSPYASPFQCEPIPYMHMRYSFYSVRSIKYALCLEKRRKTVNNIVMASAQVYVSQYTYIYLYVECSACRMRCQRCIVIAQPLAIEWFSSYTRRKNGERRKILTATQNTPASR